MYVSKGKKDDKCGRIFRPWDVQEGETGIAQDSTVSTTTEDEDLACKSERNFEDACDKRSQKFEEYDLKSAKSRLCVPDAMCSAILNDRCNTSISSRLSPVIPKCQENSLVEEASHFYPRTYGIPPNPETLVPLPVDGMQDPYAALNTDIVQTNLAHHLGLPPNDPLIMESLAQGYALEEYARVLSQEQQAKLMASKKQRPKKYKCPHCDVGFSNNGQLKGHIRIHTGERPFRCDEKDCGKTFTRNEELTRHKRIHSGVRPFPCSHCGKRFGRKDHLKKHSRTHFQPRGLYAVPVVLPFEAWASGQTNGYPFFPVMY